MSFRRGVLALSIIVAHVVTERRLHHPRSPPQGTRAIMSTCIGGGGFALSPVQAILTSQFASQRTADCGRLQISTVRSTGWEAATCTGSENHCRPVSSQQLGKRRGTASAWKAEMHLLNLEARNTVPKYMKLSYFCDCRRCS